MFATEKKLLEKQDFVPTLKNLFNREEYSIAADNGKNSDRYAECCMLYLDLKKCFPEADEPLYDAGFNGLRVGLCYNVLSLQLFINLDGEIPSYLLNSLQK